ncbi:ACP S-malonyltransferase [Kiritimatiella glycovorans]|uniref:Malonyl CoA-acyl carrier protein transacylase n=1 Tax=Kiritimatiella glycovorans TaxID=1307763 RepID=A0A0G3EFF5_9BACT|nr:ACP S-malonyltransferase [Kiritimatiella glycovorans]AKJ63520.1 Malonyl CoA-acyl carrier protein transacylase [Kiritimatiella glycovorans]
MTTRAALFPGQGSQKVGMGRDWAEERPSCRALFDQAGEVLGLDLAAVCFEGPDEKLADSRYTQPAVFTVSAAVWNALREERPGWTFAAAAGHSLGEWTALYAAGVLGFRDAVRVLKARGEFIQEACLAHPGGMSAVIGLEEEQIAEIAEATGATAANRNAPGQTVFSGSIDRLEAAEEQARAAGAKRVVRLEVAGAFHSPLMEPAAQKLRPLLDGIEFGQPAFPVLSNVTGKPHGDADSIREHMTAQIVSPVRWIDDVCWMTAQGVDTMVECGPGRVLSGLVKRIDKTPRLLTMSAVTDLKQLDEEG